MSASPRLLCHGGNGDRERARIGEWTDVGRGALMDVYGLPVGGGRYQHGCGLIAGRPVLIFRERQDEEHRSGYGYTLLLDPGDEVWEVFGWNAAALLVALGAEEPPLPPALRYTPESLSVDALEGLVRRLAPRPPGEGPISAMHPLAGAWAWASVERSDGPLALEGLVETSQTVPAEMAALVSTLPPCFRLGGGWLVGGSAPNAEAFGCALVLDLDAEGRGEDPFLLKVSNMGTELLEAWSRLEAESDLGPALRAREEVPTLFWKERFGHAAGEFAHRVVLGSRLLGRGPLGEDAVRLLADLADGRGPLASELLAVAERRLSDPRIPGEPGFQEAMARAWLEGKISRSPTASEGLDRGLLVRLMVQLRLKPVLPKVSDLLGLEARADVWQGLGGKERDRWNLPPLAQEALGDLATAGSTKVARSLAAARVLSAAIDRSLELGGSVDDWAALKKDLQVGQYVRRKFRELAKARSLSPGAGEAPEEWFEREDLPLAFEDAGDEAGEMVRAFLFEGGPSLDARRRSRFLALVSEASPAETRAALAKLVAEAVERVDRERDGGVVFVRRFGGFPEILEGLFSAAGSGVADVLLTICAREAPEAVQKRARGVFVDGTRRRRRGEALGQPHFAAAIARFLLSPAGREMKLRLDATIHGDSAGKIDGQLRALIDPGPAAKAGGADGDKKPARPTGWTSRLIDWFRGGPESGGRSR